MAKTEREIFESFLFDMIEGRHNLVDAVLHENIRWHLPPFAKQPPIQGRDAVLQFLAKAPAAFYEPGSMRIEPIEFFVQDGLVACLATLRATTKHGAPYENRYGFFARMEAGRLIEVWELLDSASLLEQMKAHA